MCVCERERQMGEDRDRAATTCVSEREFKKDRKHERGLSRTVFILSPHSGREGAARPALNTTDRQLSAPTAQLCVCVWQYASAIYKKRVSAILVFVCMRLLLLKTCIRIVNSYVCK